MIEYEVEEIDEELVIEMDDDEEEELLNADQNENDDDDTQSFSDEEGAENIDDFELDEGILSRVLN